MKPIFHRTDLAEALAQKLFRPSILDSSYESGLFISGPRRTGKTTFLTHDLIPKLKQEGAVVIYLDLWSDRSIEPSKHIHNAILNTVLDLQSGGERMLKHMKLTDVSALGVTLSFSKNNNKNLSELTLSEILKQLGDSTGKPIVLIVDEVQHALTTQSGRNALFALKAARDAINLDPDSTSKFFFIGTGSHRAQVTELVTRRNQAFVGAVTLKFPTLGNEYVAHLIDSLRNSVSNIPLPDSDVANSAFTVLGHKPEYLIIAFQNMAQAWINHQQLPDDALPVIADTIRLQTSQTELAKLDTLGVLAKTIFGKIASQENEIKGLFSNQSLSELSLSLDRKINPEEVQSAISTLLDEDLIMRMGHGTYDITDPFIREVWNDASIPFNPNPEIELDPFVDLIADQNPKLK